VQTGGRITIYRCSTFLPPSRKAKVSVFQSRALMGDRFRCWRCRSDRLRQLRITTARADKLFGANGKLFNAGTWKFLKDFVQSNDSWMTANIKSWAPGDAFGRC
jgi:hypothetical protein